MNLLDLFSGAGGLTEGFRNNNYEFIYHIEMDADACYTLKTREAFYFLKKKEMLHYYNMYLNSEITREELYNLLPTDELEKTQKFEINDDSIFDIFQLIDSKIGTKKVDGIIGGPPCQAYSTIGRARNKEKKSTDSRIYLYEYYVKFLEKYQPSFFIFENVKGLLSFKDLKEELLFPKIINAFMNIGYNVEFKIINSADFGVPQKRERLILVGIKKDKNIKESFFELLETQKETPPNLYQLFSDLPKIKSGMECNHYITSDINSYLKKYIRKHKDIPLTFHRARLNNKNDLKIYELVATEKRNGNNLRYTDLPPSLQTHSNRRSFLDRFKALDGNSVSHTIVAHISKDGHHYIHPDVKQNRSITVREAARIQTFSDDFYFESSRTSAFKQIGNAVPPLLAEKLSKTILKLFKEELD